MTSKLRNHPPRARDAERSRTAILDAAAALFAEVGYQATTLAAVGRRAGVSRGTPGYFFGSKSDLYQSVLEHCFAKATDTIRIGRIRALKSGRPAAEVLEGAVSDYVDFVAANPAFVRLIQREAMGEGTGLDTLPLGKAAGSEAVAALAVELGFPAEQDGRVSHLVLSLLALTWFPLLHTDTLVPAVGLDASRPDFLATRKRHITTLLLGALPPERPTPPRRSSK